MDRSLFTGRGWLEILRGATFLASRRWGGHLILARKILKKPAKPIFPRVSGKNKTKNFSENIFLRGGTFFGGLENKNLRPPLPINNEPSLTLIKDHYGTRRRRSLCEVVKGVIVLPTTLQKLSDLACKLHRNSWCHFDSFWRFFKMPIDSNENRLHHPTPDPTYAEKE